MNEGVPEDLAEVLAMPEDLFSHLGIVQQLDQLPAGQALDGSVCSALAMNYYRLKEHLHLAGFIRALAAIPISNTWQAQVRDAYLLEVEQSLSHLALRA